MHHGAGGEFEERIGTAKQPEPDHLRNGLWAASQLLAGSSHAYKRVLVFSADANPAGAGPKADTYKCACCAAWPLFNHIAPPDAVCRSEEQGTALLRLRLHQ